MKILVTGADDFIGSHPLESLISQGQKVRALSMYNSFNLLIIGDGCSFDLVSSMILIR